MYGMRIDKYLTKYLDVESRSKAQQLIESGCVAVDGILVHHPSYDVKKGANVEVKKADNFVSRGAYKLLGAIVDFGLNFKNKVVLDIGSSTGGFTQVALLNNAKHIYCVDVGTEQLHPSLRGNERITLYENTNLKDIELTMFKTKINIILADLSFISLTALLNKVTKLFDYHVTLVVLIKPQFELSKEIVDKCKGVIKLPNLHQKAVDKVIDHARKLGFNIIKVAESSILGKDGNKEFFAHLEWK